ncbi:MAG: ATP-binding protein [Nitrospiria bacterium]
MKCQKCGQKAVIRISRANAKYCKPCFIEFFISQVRRALLKDKMVHPDDRILVAVSGGKDSLALWQVLIQSGYQTAGLHIDLGIGSYSGSSSAKVEAFASKFQQPFYSYRLKEAHEMGIVELSRKLDRSPCSACGTIKRYHFNRFAVQNGFTVLATGHNLDDEAARLLGNLLRWQEEYLAKQSPVLERNEVKQSDLPVRNAGFGGIEGSAEGGPDGPLTRIEGFVKKIKPLYRLSEYEVAAYSFLNQLDYVVEECPMSQSAPMLVYKKALNLIEHHSPGTKHQFYLSFLENQKKKPSPASTLELRPCSICGQPTPSTVCGYCKIISRLPVRVEHVISD